MKPVDVLKKGLSKLHGQVRDRKVKLEAKLKAGQPISEADQDWLDGDGNLVDEDRVVEALEKASDYEKYLEGLSPLDKLIVEKLQKLAGKAHVPSKKRKRSAKDCDGDASSESAQAGRKPTRPPEKKQNATLQQRIEILDWHQDNKATQQQTADHFNKVYPSLQLTQPTISSWVTNENKWRTAYENSQTSDRHAKRTRQTEHPAVTEMLELWVSKAMEDQVLLTGEVIRQKWKQFADLVGVPDDERLNLSEGWLTAFKAHNGLKNMKRHGEGGSVPKDTVEEERARVQKLIQELVEKEGYELRDIFNADETSFFYGMPPDRGLSDRKNSGIKGQKHRLTYLFATNADGSKKLPPLIIGKYQKPRAFNKHTGSELGFDYHHNANAWMTAKIYQEWLLDWDRKLRTDGRKVILLQDNFSGHVVPEAVTNIRAINFKPNLTAHVQPCDQGIIRCFKAKYRAQSIQAAVKLYETGTTPSQIYNKDQLQAMRLAKKAWEDVDTTVIRNCWRKAGILPSINSLPLTPPSVPISKLIHTNPVAEAEKELSKALDALEATGALQRSNRMTIEEFLNPIEEAHHMFQATDQDIYNAVMDARAVRERIAAGGTSHQPDDGDDEPVQVRSTRTRKEALQAALIVEEYISGLNGPYARNLESMLCSLAMQTRFLDPEMRDLKDTKLTSYFEHA